MIRKDILTKLGKFYIILDNDHRAWLRNSDYEKIDISLGLEG